MQHEENTSVVNRDSFKFLSDVKYDERCAQQDNDVEELFYHVLPDGTFTKGVMSHLCAQYNADQTARNLECLLNSAHTNHRPASLRTILEDKNG